MDAVFHQGMSQGVSQMCVCVCEKETERERKREREPSNSEEATIFELASLCVLECPQGLGRRPG